MHIWDENPVLPIMHHKATLKKMDYSHCPLKKRPVHFVKYIKEEMDYGNSDDYVEPENLSTKPQDLSVKCKSVHSVVQTALVAQEVKKKSPSPYHHNVMVSSATQSLYYHQHQQSSQQAHHPYHPTAVKAGPLEPLCLNIAAGNDHHHSHNIQTSATTAFHNHYRTGHYAPSSPRPVPAQYPGTDYLADYLYHHGGLQAAESAFPAAAAVAVTAATATVYPSMMAATVRDLSLSPPGSSSGTGSAFKPLHALPSSTSSTVTSCSPPIMSWYGNKGPSWSPSAMDTQISPPLSLPSSSSSSSMSAVSPLYGQPVLSQPPPSVLYHPAHMQCSGDSDASSSFTATEHCTNENKRKPVDATARFKCSSCPREYSTALGLTKHQQNHCSEDDYGVTLTPKTFCCKYCEKAYNTLGALKMHIRTHTLPCICKLCGKAFSRPWLLQGHIRTHTGEKPFSCPHCNRAFADRSNLRAHLQTHSDVKKYSCPSCSKTFSRMSLLTKHCDTGCPRFQSPQQ